MKIEPFKLERYLAQYEFTSPFLMCCSDCEPLTLEELTAMADEDSLAMWKNLSLGYTDSKGHPVLRRTIAQLYQRVEPGDVLVTCPEEGIFITMNVLLEKDDHVVITYPGYQSLYQVALSLGCHVTPWFPQEDKGWRFDVDFLERVIRDNPETKMIIVNFPHNPTGAMPSPADFQRILDIARDHDIYLFSDEMYRYLEYREEDRLPSAAGLYEKFIVLSGMSKTFSLAGLRLGWLVTGNPGLMQKLLGFKDYTTICNNAPGEILALMAIRAKDKIIARNRSIIDHNLQQLDRFFADQSQLFSWTRPLAGTIGFPRLLHSSGAAKFCQDLREEQGVVLLPSQVYDYGDEHFRVGFGRRDMPQALALLEKYIAAGKYS